VIDCAERRQHFRPGRLRIQRALRTFELADGAITIKSNHQNVALPAGGLQVSNVPDVKQVEAAIGEDKRFAGVRRANRRGFGPGNNFWERFDAFQLGLWRRFINLTLNHRLSSMTDPRFDALAEVLTGFSTSLQPDEHVLIEAFDVPPEIVIALIRRARKRGAIPHVQLQSNRIRRELLLEARSEQYQALADYELKRMENVDAYIALRGSHNITEESDVPTERLLLAAKLLKPVLDRRVNQTKWVVLRWPTPSMAQMAEMSTEAFEDFYFQVCTLDYQRMQPGMKALKALMEQTDEVRIRGAGTDLRFSIKGIPSITCGGLHNIPDGEVFTAPVRDSVEGTLQYNTPSVYQGTAFDGVKLTFKAGKIVEATSNQAKKLNAILDSDDGARYIGEFALGFNPYILYPMRDILFDEKISGSFHFTPGQAYERADNGNRSQVHWDLVCIQRPEFGGGEIWFDDTLVRKDGRFVVPGPDALNPEHLTGNA